MYLMRWSLQIRNDNAYYIFYLYKFVGFPNTSCYCSVDITASYIE